MRICITLACILTASALTACANKNGSKPTATATQTSGKMVTVNTMCPIGGDEFGSAPGDTRSYKGTTVGFCCSNCSAKFDKMTDSEKENVCNLAKANKVKGH